MTDEQINELGPALSTYVRTTSEHPFHVLGVGWVEAASLRPGDLLTCLGETPVAVEEVYDTGEHEVVYNLSISEAHTYFVGCQEWRFRVWAHNNGEGCLTGRTTDGKPSEPRRITMAKDA